MLRSLKHFGGKVLCSFLPLPREAEMATNNGERRSRNLTYPGETMPIDNLQPLVGTGNYNTDSCEIGIL